MYARKYEYLGGETLSATYQDRFFEVAMSNISQSHIRREEAALKECRRIGNNSELPIFNDI